MRRIYIIALLVSIAALAGCAPTLHSAASSGDTGQLQQFINAGHDVNARGGSDYTPLHHATLNNKTAVIRILLDSGAHTDLKDSIGDTPLHNTAYGGHIDAAKMLVDAGASTTITNNKGKTYIDIARKNDKTAYIAAMNMHVAGETAASLAEKEQRLARERALFEEMERETKKQKERAAFSSAQAANTFDSWRSYLDAHPHGDNSEAALKALAALLVQNGNAALIAESIDAYPALASHLPLKFALFHIGPPELTVAMVIKYKEQDIGDELVAAKIMSTQSQYKKFDIDEILELKRMGLTEPVIKAMVDVTTQTRQSESVRRLEADNDRLRAEVDRLRGEMDSLRNRPQAAAAVAAPVEAESPGVAENIANCVAQAAAIEACNNAPGGMIGQSICKAAAKASFPCE